MNKSKSQNIVNEIKEFEKAINDFQLYNPVKVARELKNEFQLAINIHFINMGICSWSATITPLKKSYKFQRT